MSERDDQKAAVGGKKYARVFSGKWSRFAWGNFVTILINFVILAFVIFLMIRQINRLKRAEPAAPPAAAPATPEDVVLLREIRDALNKR